MAPDSTPSGTVTRVLAALESIRSDRLDDGLWKVLVALGLQDAHAGLAVWQTGNGPEEPVLVAVVGDTLTCRELEGLRGKPSHGTAQGALPDESLEVVAHRTPTECPGELIVCIGVSSSERFLLGDQVDLRTALQALGLVLRPLVATSGMDAIGRAALAVHASLDRATVLSNICRESAAILGADMAALYRDCVDHVTVEAAWGVPSNAVGYSMRKGRGVAGKVLRDSAPAWTEDYGADDADWLEGSPFAQARAGVGVPVRIPGRPGAVLSVGYARPFRPRQQHVARLQALAELAASAFANAEAHGLVEQAAKTDALTGCRNQAGFREVAERHLSRGGALTIVLLDLNHFKAVNDAHGHLTGDEVLCEVAQSIKAILRREDVAARIGGDEFAIALPGAGESVATAVAQRVIAAATRAMRDLVARARPGAAAGVASAQPGWDYRRLISEADRALYFAKQDRVGRRCVVASAVPREFMARECRAPSLLKAV